MTLGRLLNPSELRFPLLWDRDSIPFPTREIKGDDVSYVLSFANFGKGSRNISCYS